MITITHGQFKGTAEELRARVAAYVLALEEHKDTVGVPAPREEDFIENLVRDGDDFQLESEIILPAPTLEQIQAAMVAGVQAYMDSAARSRGYDNIFTVVTYADEPAVPRFQKDGIAFRLWRSLVWDKCYAILGEVSAGTREIPSADALMAELPLLSF